MIDITTALYNILHSKYGKDVRQSIHDGISQINDNANEALQNAKTMGVGTAVTSSTSSSTGYVEGNLYLNNSTWDLWKCVGTNSWQNTGNIKGLTGAKGTDGINNFIYIKYSAHYDGTDFTSTPTASSQFIGIYYGQSTTAPTNKQDYQWTSYVGAPGTSAYIYIRYSEKPDGTNLVDVPTPLTKYIGFYAGSSASAPAGKQYYTWSEYVGKSGSGSGDMLASEYAPSGIAGTVDLAVHADEADEATDATNASNLKKSNGETMSADDVTTKLDEISAEPDSTVDFNFDTSTPYINAKVKSHHATKPPTAEGEWFEFTNTVFSELYNIQKVVAVNTGKEYTRYCYNGTYSAWYSVNDEIAGLLGWKNIQFKTKCIYSLSEANGITENGLYEYNTTASGDLLPGAWGLLLHLTNMNRTTGYGYRYQLLFSTADSQIFYRMNINSSGWINWKKISLVDV